MNNLSNESLKEKLRSATMLLSHEHADVRHYSQENVSVLTELLAFREAAEKPAAYRYRRIGSDDWESCVEEPKYLLSRGRTGHTWEYRPLFAAAPLPVVPDEMTIAQAKQLHSGTKEMIVSFADGYNACRAVMLNHIPDSGNMVNSPVTPDGWALVPIDATMDMLKEGARQNMKCESFQSVWKAMLAIAPKPEVE